MNKRLLEYFLPCSPITALVIGRIARKHRCARNRHVLRLDELLVRSGTGWCSPGAQRRIVTLTAHLSPLGGTRCCYRDSRGEEEEETGAGRCIVNLAPTWTLTGIGIGGATSSIPHLNLNVLES